MVQVMDVKLPDRTRARLDAEGNQQRVMKPHDIRGSIPLVDYTNPAKFPPYVFREYPKMPLLDGNRPIIIDESGGVLVFYDAADEVDFKSLNPELADEVERNAPAKAMADTLAAQADEIEDLRAKLRAAGIETAKKEPKSALSNVVRPKPAADVKATEKPAEGLRDTLPKTDAPSNLQTQPGNPLKKNKH